RLVQTAPPARRLALMGHAPLSAEERRAALAGELTALGLAADALGPPVLVAEIGPDHAGRYAVGFANPRAAPDPVGDALADPLRPRRAPPAGRPRGAPPDPPGARARAAACDGAGPRPPPARLCGAEPTKNQRERFSRHFARRTRHALATLPAADNPYLWSVLA